MNRNLTFYLLILILFGSLIWLVINKGEELGKPQSTNVTELAKSQENASQPSTSNISDSTSITDYIKGKLQHPISLLILQIIIIIIVSRVFGFLFGKIGQPTVIGEIIAGITLGPSILGAYFPNTFAFLFPSASLGNLELLSQIGLILFMFIVGMELDIKILKLQVKPAMVISHTSIVFSFFLGVCLAYFLFVPFAPPRTSFASFACFIGIAMSIVAFPVLARIIQERGMTKTTFGKSIITIAAIEDLTAWCLLAVVIAFIQAGNPVNAIITIVSAILFIILMLLLAQPLLNKLGDIYITKEILNKKIIAFVFFIIFISAYFTEIIGIKSLFGGFLAGVIMPQQTRFKKIMAEKIEDFSLVVLLPLFFAFTGLRTHIGLLNQGHLWTICGLVIIIAIVGKFGGNFLAARFIGKKWKESLLIGVLMNTRGLMELIVLNIGYDIGILSPEIFTMFVIMTLVTTFMTGPVLSFIEYLEKKRAVVHDHFELKRLKILISFGIPQMGVSLLKIAYSLSAKDSKHHYYSALHLTPHTEVSHSDALKFESTSFEPINSEALKYEITLKTIYKTTEDVTKEILRTTRKERSNLLLMGAAKSVFNKNVFGGRVKNIVDQAKCNVGVFIDKDFQDIKNVLILTDNIHYENFLNISERLLINSDCTIRFILSEGAAITGLPEILKNEKRITFTEDLDTHATSLKQFDVLITNLDYFEQKLRESSSLLEATPSLLLLNFKDNKIFSL